MASTDPEAGGPPSVGVALRWSAGAFRSHPVTLIACAAVVAVLMVPQQLATRPFDVLADCLNARMLGASDVCTDAITPGLAAPLLIAAVFSAVALIAQYGTQRAALMITQGGNPSVAESFAPRRLGAYVLFVVGTTVVAAVGLMLCVLPGLAVLLFMQLGGFAILDRGCGVLEAVRSSARLIAANIGPALGLGIVNLLAFMLGGLFYGIATLVTLPFASLVTAHLYRQFTGSRVT